MHERKRKEGKEEREKHERRRLRGRISFFSYGRVPLVPQGDDGGGSMS
jgi:hypothetical protein